MSAHCNDCGSDLNYDLSCAYCDIWNERDRYRELLLKGSRVAKQYMDTGRGDLDGWFSEVDELLATSLEHAK